MRESWLGIRVTAFVLVALIISSGLLAARADVSQWPASCTELVNDGGFEAGGQGWTQYSKLGFQLIDPFYPRSGKLGAWLGAENDAYDQITQTLMLPSGSASITLNLWWALFTQENPGGAFDHLKVLLYAQDGATLLATLLNVNNDSADQWVWNPSSVDLLAYAGQTVQLRIVATTDQNNPTSFFVDDVSILACGAENTPTATASPSATITDTPVPGTPSITPTATQTSSTTPPATQTATATRTITITSDPSMTPTGPTMTPTATPTIGPQKVWLYLPLIFGRQP